VLAVAGIDVVVHGDEHRRGERHIFVANHNSGVEIFALFSRLRWVKFVAKAELFRIPIVGRAMRYAGMIPIERANRTGARASIQLAGTIIASGASVILFPEGTRSRTYELRPFKKGAFVLAIETQSPIVPVAVYGTVEIMPKGSLLVRPGRVHLHFLPPIDTEGKSYDDRDALADDAQSRIAECLRREYGVTPAPERAESRANA
jgi:1-acyl-sn-glycerol-3-phosphate acyltransferase